MNDFNQTPIVTMKPALSRVVVLAIVVIVAALVLVAVAVFISSNSNSQPMAQDTHVSIATDVTNVTEQIVETTPTGTIHFSAFTEAIDGVRTPGVFALSVLGEDIDDVHDIPASFLNPGTSTSAMILYFSDSQDPDGFQPATFNSATGDYFILPHINGYNEMSLTMSPDGSRYAYIYQVDPRTDKDEIQNWNIAIHSTNGSYLAIIEGAVEPQWFNNGNDVAFLKNNGIFQFNLASRETKVLYGEYSDFSTLDGLALSPDSRHLILTIPLMNGIVVLELQPDALRLADELIRIRDDGFRYFHPIISPGGSFYAVVTYEDTDVDEVTGEFTSASVEIRDIETSEIVEAYFIDDFVASSINLTGWVN